MLLAVPHFVWLSGWTLVAGLAAVPQWVFMLAAGRPSAGLHRFLASYLRYATHVWAYLYLVADPWPGFLGRGGRYPVDLIVPGPAPQPRWETLLRFVLAVPCLVFSQVLAEVAQIVAVLAWFVCVALGRIPKGMRDLNTYCLRYQGQALGYVLLLTARYPQLASAERYYSGSPRE
jgi:uncharacterized protein DUF4389